MSEFFPHLSHAGNRVVFFDISIGGSAIGRLQIELLYNICPKTCENFRQLCTGEFMQEEKPVGYKNTQFFKILKDFIIQGGDVLNNDGTGNISICGGFEDESYEISHESAGLVCMAHDENERNGSQFFITLAPCEWLNGKNAVFGKLYPFQDNSESFSILRRISSIPFLGDKPTLEVLVQNCGEM